MRSSECNYWDNNFKALKDHVIFDNVWKRQVILRKLLKHDFMNTKVLEIGVGTGAIASIFNRLYMSKCKYVCTDVSDVVCKFSADFGIDAIKTDITDLPKIDGGFDYIIALDVLEHINPDDRPAGYAEMHSVLTDGGCVVINNPLDESGHDDEFDYGFYNDDIIDMCSHGFYVEYRKPYSVKANKIDLNYEWIEMRKI